MYQTLLQVKKEFLNTSNTGELLIKHLFVTAGYAVCFLIFYALSKNFFTHQGWTTWYMPMGFRVAAMLILPIRYWPTLLFTEFCCHRFITVYYGTFSLTPFFEALSRASAVYLGYTIFTLPAKLILRKIDVADVKYCLLLLIAIFGQSVVAATNLAFFNRFYSSIPVDRKIEIWLSFITGGAIGGLLVAPLMMGCYQLINDKKISTLNSTSLYLLAYATLLTAIYRYLQLDPGSLYVIVALALMPVVLFSYNLGWTGSLFATAITNVFLAVSVYGHSGTLTMQQIQLFVVVLNISALLFGAVISNQKKLASSLMTSNIRLQQLAVHNQQLANRFVTVQENERKAVSQELHDDIGQIVTGLKTELKVMAKTSTDEHVQRQLPRIMNATTAIYDSVYRLMHKIRPRLLDEHGLHNALTSGELMSALQNAGISYNHIIDVDLSTLSQNIQIAIFRICQEAFTNVIKHSAATECHLSIGLSDNFVVIEIKDNGNADGKEPDISGGFGLSGIQDRVCALNGNFYFNVSNKGTALSISIPA